MLLPSLSQKIEKLVLILMTNNFMLDTTAINTGRQHAVAVIRKISIVAFLFFQV